jgi:hypothetical protein
MQFLTCCYYLSTCKVFQELPGDLSYSELHFFSQFKDLQQRGVAQSFAWLTGILTYYWAIINIRKML